MDSGLGVFFVGFTHCSLDFLIFPTESTNMNLSLFNPITCVVTVCVCVLGSYQKTNKTFSSQSNGP